MSNHTIRKLLFACFVFSIITILQGCDNSQPETPDLPVLTPVKNQLPIAETGPNRKVIGGERVHLSGKNSKDPDGTITAYLWQQVGGEEVFIESASESEISFVAPNNITPTKLAFRLTVLDNQGGSAEKTVDVSVSPSNSDNLFPVALTENNMTVSSGSIVNLTAKNSYDSDGSIDEFYWQQISGPNVSIDDPFSQTSKFIAPVTQTVETLSFTLSVTDNDGAVSTDTINVTVRPEFSASIQSSTSTLSTTVTLTSDSEIIATPNELVTFALPLAPGLIKNTNNINVSINGLEQSIAVKPGLKWHWKDNSLRSITIQLQNVDMTMGDIVLVISNSGRNNSNDLIEQPYLDGWVPASDQKANMLYPRIFALHDKQYLANSEIIPPYLPASNFEDDFEKYQVNQFNNWSGKLNYKKSGGANWLFDRSTAYFKAYITTGRVKFLKEAILSKQFYFSKVRNDNSKPSKKGGRGCWKWKSVACADGKYISPQQAKLAWALVGDNSQWDKSLIVDMALQSDLGWNQYGSRDPFNKENEGFTERGAGMAGLAEVAAYEITGDKKVLKHLNQRVEALADMQQTEKPWDKANGWTPKSGGFEHNFHVHEGNYREKNAPKNDSNARAFSAWMSENIADFLWQAYWVTHHESIPEMLRLLGNAVDLYGFTSEYNTVTKQYEKRAAFAKINKTHTKSCNRTGKETDLVYFASKWADDKTLTSNDFWPYYSDTHNIETVLILATAYYFEKDLANRERLAARIEKIEQGWINSECAKVFSNVHRLFSWQHRSNSIRTWHWIKKFPYSGAPKHPQKVIYKAKIQDKNMEGHIRKPIVMTSNPKIAELVGDKSIAFSDLTSTAIDNAPFAYQPFWIGMPDVNADGCSDLFVGTHNDNRGSSQMFLHDVISGKCNNTFSHYDNSYSNYSQKGKGRITSRYIFSNITKNKGGLPDFFGSDADGGNSVIYPLLPSVKISAPPIYSKKIIGCRGGKNRCLALDINGDGNVEFLSSAYTKNSRRRIYNPLNNETIIPSILDSTTLGFKSFYYLIVDVDGDSWPDVVSGENYGYWRYNPITKDFDDFVVAFNEAKKNFSRDNRRPTNQMQVSLDYDNDGDFDILFGSGRWKPGELDKEFYLSLHRNNGDGTFTDVTEVAGGGKWTDGSLRNQNNWTTYAGIYPGDFNNDGYIDFMTMSQSYRNAPRLFRNNGDGTFTTIRNLITNGGAGVDVFRPWGNVKDWNNDGFLDVAILSNGVKQVKGLRLYKNKTNRNHWLKIRARGLNNNTDGYHTKFTLFKSETDEILGSRYLGNFNTADARFIAHFGLADITNVDLQVEYPHGGPIYQYKNLSVNKEFIAFRDGCLMTDWQAGSGWPLNSNGQNCRTPDNLH